LPSGAGAEITNYGSGSLLIFINDLKKIYRKKSCLYQSIEESTGTQVQEGNSQGRNKKRHPKAAKMFILEAEAGAVEPEPKNIRLRNTA
jgi:hypothetical protein